MRRLKVLAVAGIAAVALTACSAGSSEAGGEEAGTEVRVGLLTSLSGDLAVAGRPWADGFRAGIDYATDGTGEVSGVAIEIVEGDDASDPNAGLTEATNMVSGGVEIITGSASSAVALGLADFAAENNILFISGSANSDAMTGLNANTFRSTRSSSIDTNTAIELVGDKLDGADLTVLAHDIEYGKNAAGAFVEAAGDRPDEVNTIFAPYPDTDVAPFVQKAKATDLDILAPFWSGDTLPWYKALDAQAVMDDGTIVVTNTATRGSWPDYEAIWNDNLYVYTSWPPEALDNEPSKFLDEAAPETDFHAADGFAAAQMVVHAIDSAAESGEAGGDGNVEAMITALEGYTFEGPRGETTIRAEDHAMLAPMYRVSYETGLPEVVETFDAESTAPDIEAIER